MTSTSRPAEPADPLARPAALALARTHLRLGSLALARVELETLAGAGELDGPGQADLAEARWRTGDLSRAGEAAAAALATIGDEPVALVIAAEAAAALGRPNEARRLATRAMSCLSGPIDAIFAGMPRSAVWPVDAAEPPPTAATLFHQEPIVALARRAGDSDTFVASGLRTSSAEIAASGSASRAAVTPGFWDADASEDPGTPDLPDPAEELEAGRRALVAGSVAEASLRFALTLRLAPALAPAVLEATEGGVGPALNVVRGDAFRLVGLEAEARRAFAMAAWSGSRDRRRPPDEAVQPAASDTIPRVQRSHTQGKHARK
jgi:hypothetical protein